MSSSSAVGHVLAVGVFVAVAGVVAVSVLAGGVAAGTVSVADQPTAQAQADVPTAVATQDGVSEEAFVEPVPEEGDAYFEAAAEDDSWVSYINPRDEYRSPYLGEGSGKLCVALVNEQGEPVAGESIPGTTVTVPTGEELEWHGDADPFTVEYPLTDNYDRPLDSDQFGTTDDLPQGDGYLDSHCFEWHGLTENDTVSYSDATIEGEHADDIELVGYVQQTHESWDTDVDPIDDARPYEETGGGWTYHPDGSHGQVVVVVQLDGEPVHSTVDDFDEDSSESSDSEPATEPATPGDDSTATADDAATSSDDAEAMPGFGTVAVLSALTIAVLERIRRSGG
ncbi:PGF-CTERM sorting domain-containing protein [Salinadaptatus halalkaliphilus]|uniref:PGF-CTERM sorting domain-containing protein n=1 Tax=Salinadaptatus halalkaliphilus TaxID=2419781 RepID=A0A4S3TMQ9_9EURY|nr:PGF-CTERM sorting domain-containing protein [Salinadaptatus halalkaliphilus]THE64335.1 PGF-CTERM sorting domain-containing protein [Salinadaptatus halalkaliphilus]